MQTVPQIRIFLASPGDVNEERAVALEVLDMLEYDPLFKRDGSGGVSIHAVAWDKPGGDTPMRATKTPQTAIKEGLPTPSDCDVVLVLFWSRMGTPLPHPEYQKGDGTPYLSGTEWEFWNAINAEREHGKPITLVYRRTEKPDIDIDNEAAIDQYRSVGQFFKQFRDASGALTGGVNEYDTPENLRLKLLMHLRGLINDILNDEGWSAATAPASAAREVVEAPPIWEGSPFPGLRAFTEADAPIFFGRGRETSELVKRVEASRFVAVVAASGSGKSSLVAAGLIPRLKANAIVSGETGSKDWRFVRFAPGEEGGPLVAMFKALLAAFPEHKTSPFMVVQERTAFTESLQADPRALSDMVAALLAEADAPGWSEVLFFIDQFEELFTLVTASDRAVFIKVLQTIATSTRMRCIVTMRSDFMATAIEYPELATLINGGNYVLAPPTAGALVEMIKRPAERAGLTWEDGLPERIQAETGSGSGALAVMAYALDELYHAAGEDKRLTEAAYDAIGGVEGAIGKRADDTFTTLELPEKGTVLKRVFRELVTVNASGTPTRQRAHADQFNDDGITLIQAFIRSRLLVSSTEEVPRPQGEGFRVKATVEVAHEALFRSWERLKEWIAEAQEDLILLRQVRTAAAEWHEKKRPDFLLWPQERLTLVYAMQDRLHPELNEVERDFIEPEQERLYRELEIITTTHQRRYDIGERLARIGDTREGIGLKDNKPGIIWLPVNGSNGAHKFEFGEFEVKPFFIAKYLTTLVQVQAFLDSDWDNPRWWEGFPDDYQPQNFGNVINGNANAPRDIISWYQSVAFGRWMAAQFEGLALEHPSGAILRVGDNAEIRLPTEWEWQWAAQAGQEARKYPWGEWDEHPRANTTEAGINDRSTAVGMYPHGVAECGALDMAGNLYDWCQNDSDDPSVVAGFGNDNRKVLRGGSFNYINERAAASYRYANNPSDFNYNFGVRLVVGAPIASLVSGSLTSGSE